MLAKAVAAECGSNFMNITASVIYNMYVGEGEKNAKAIFTLARKLAPCVIFIDELDSIFDARDSSRSSATKREVINEFMSEWDGVASRNNGVIVVGATNRPFDLDDAVLRRLPRRLMLDLPGEAEREHILRLQLAGERLADDVDLQKLAERTKSFSGSDLKNVCMTAALQAVREQLQQELSAATAAAGSSNDGNNNNTLVDENGLLRVQPEAEDCGDNTENTSNQDDRRRLLYAKHFEQALAEVSSSVHEDQESLERLRRWNQMFGDGNRQSKAASRRLGFH
jgi:SpoVK/Ycf46/Vps4 family AAA+-type ATPase